jgi:glycosyltransferase involved in cell wall biosynthesis
LRILFVAPYAPSPIRVRPFQFLRQLVARGHAVTLVCPTSGANDGQALDTLRRLCPTVAVPHGRRAILEAYLRAVPGSLPLQAAHCLSPALVREAMASDRFDIVHIEHLRGAEVARVAAAGLSGAPPLVLDAVDSISLLFERALRHNPAPGTRAMALLDLARTRRYEAAYGQTFAQVVITSPEDRWALETLRRQFKQPPGAPIRVVPNGVDCDYFQPPQTAREPATILFSGKMSYHANEAAALHLLREIMPLVWRQRPDARVIIAGANPGPRLRAWGRDSRVEITGYVPELRAYLQRATLAVAPLTYGVGIQNKVLEALACATPVVATRQATVALQARAGVELLAAGSVSAFTEAIVTLLEDANLRARLGQAGRTYIERHHTWNASAVMLELAYHAALQATSSFGSEL